ncbi:hypothetical protein BDV38DRAFT_234441 [Aspergillus pseudotamarii]|uniref:Uncharacterized protein n=1 Tax=Aspergillus pseudotamarii TaxID=132259 RepID=A0A5N6TA20_ASPPS|nr:uncharacterized protein BDV38DRAFT_234441 [Aspergillus pseudotamarii]KAE8143029.1 hypothetical protein BDV38DRAFT_234441 [Aspergillus pseudotamarii]
MKHGTGLMLSLTSLGMGVSFPFSRSCHVCPGVLFLSMHMELVVVYSACGLIVIIFWGIGTVVSFLSLL